MSLKVKKSILTSQGKEIELVTSYKYLGFLVDNESENLILPAFSPLLDYGDMLFMGASTKCLQSLDIVYHCALRFVTDWSWLNFIYKTFLSLVPPYVCAYLQKVNSHYDLHSSDVFYLSVPRVQTEPGKRAFSFSAPSAQNTLQKDLKLTDLHLKLLVRCKQWNIYLLSYARSPCRLNATL